MVSALASFNQNKSDVDRLMEIHATIGGEGPGRKWNVEVLHKAAIVLTCAVWEAFAEDLILEAIEHIAKHLASPDKLPIHLKKQIAKQIKSDLHDLSPWQLAGNGWQGVVRDNATTLVGAVAGRLNTPKSEQLKDLYKRSLGMPDITSSWIRRKLTPEQACKRLDEFITLRGAIAHRGQDANSVTKAKAEGFLALVSELVGFTDQAVRAHAYSLTGKRMR